MRAAEGPGLIHAKVTRPYSHSAADTQSKYRTLEDLADEERSRDGHGVPADQGADHPCALLVIDLLHERFDRSNRIGIGVPDLAAAKQYYDELMSILGLREWFDTGPGGPLNYGPDGDKGSQLFFYQAEEPGTYSRRETGLHHLAFLVASRAIVREAHEWARARDAVVLDEPGEFPQYGPHCFATYWLDPHGIKLEAVCHTPEDG